MRIPNEQGEVGKYDKECEEVFHSNKADAAIVIVLGGERGSGFSVTLTHSGLAYQLPDVLERMAQDIRTQLQGQANS